MGAGNEAFILQDFSSWAPKGMGILVYSPCLAPYASLVGPKAEGHEAVLRGKGL